MIQFVEGEAIVTNPEVFLAQAQRVHQIGRTLLSNPEAFNSAVSVVVHDLPYAKESLVILNDKLIGSVTPLAVGRRAMYGWFHVDELVVDEYAEAQNVEYRYRTEVAEDAFSSLLSYPSANYSLDEPAVARINFLEQHGLANVTILKHTSDVNEDEVIYLDPSNPTLAALCKILSDESDPQNIDELFDEALRNAV